MQNATTNAILCIFCIFVVFYAGPGRALLINKNRGGSVLAKIQHSKKVKIFLFENPKKVNSLNFQTQKSKLLYFDPVLPECCLSRSPQIIFMALATVSRITLAF